ncbi:hypothetical protein BJ165DRAFT_1524255 [Panaeolus papilionaceus]|nr:hypothetical protein BJ165DRAFT_1524255 [Panaeolus papilionaceus]
MWTTAPQKLAQGPPHINRATIHLRTAAASPPDQAHQVLLTQMLVSFKPLTAVLVFLIASAVAIPQPQGGSPPPRPCTVNSQCRKKEICCYNPLTGGFCLAPVVCAAT